MLILVALLVVVAVTAGPSARTRVLQVWGQMPWSSRWQSINPYDLGEALVKRAGKAWFVVFATREDPRLVAWGADTRKLAERVYADCQSGRLTPGKTLLFCRLARQEEIWLTPEGRVLLDDAGKELAQQGFAVGDVYSGSAPVPSRGPRAYIPKP